MIKQLMILMALLPVLASAYTLDTGHALYANMKGIYVFDNRADDGDNIAGTGTMVGTVEDADGFDAPVSQTFQAWYNSFGSAYTICIWHGGMTVGTWGAIYQWYSATDGSALVCQRDNANDRFRCYHNGVYATLTTLNNADIASAQMLAVGWNTTDNNVEAWDDGVSLGSVSNTTDPFAVMTDAGLSFNGTCTITRIYLFDADIGTTAIAALVTDPDSIFVSAVSGAQIF